MFQEVFNILYEEKCNCHLSKERNVEDKVLNWSRINSVICFNYLQQAFYLVSPTMKTLAKGTSETAIIKLLRVLIQVSQGSYGEMNGPGAEEEIADVVDFAEAEIEEPPIHEPTF